MPTIKLSYFDFAASRGEECRLALHLAGVPFVDDRVKVADFPARKANTPFGALPVLEVEGHPPIAQANTILRLIGKQHGLHPLDEWEAARHEAIMGATEDLRNRLSPLSRIKDPEEKKRQREEIASGYMQEWGAAIERQLGEGPFVGGARIQVVDLKLYVTQEAFVSGKIDHIAVDVFKRYARLSRVHTAVKSHPQVMAWYAR